METFNVDIRKDILAQNLVSFFFINFEYLFCQTLKYHKNFHKL